MPANPYLAATATANGILVTALELTDAGRLTGFLRLPTPLGHARQRCTWLPNGCHLGGKPGLALVLPAEPLTPTT